MGSLINKKPKNSEKVGGKNLEENGVGIHHCDR
jgi:hypothetical protein